MEIRCPHCQRFHDAPVRRPTDWCPSCYRAWLKEYPANVRAEYGELCAALFGKEREEAMELEEVSRAFHDAAQ